MVHLKYVDLSLSRIRAVLAHLDNIHDKIPNIIHVAGTNGKGSTVAFMRSILEAHGYSVNVFTSPHLVNYNERFRIKGCLISDLEISQLQKQLEGVEGYLDLSVFEATTVLGYLAFYNNKADFTILETGLGGRLDATNMIKNPILNVLTTIDYDHQNFLGDTLDKIAYEKAGIIKKGAVVISDYQAEVVKKVFHNVVKINNCKGFFGGEDYTIEDGWLIYNSKRTILNCIGLLGEHQIKNAALSVVACSNIKNIVLKEDAIQSGLLNVQWAGRLQKVELLYGVTFNVEDKIYLDGSHNPSGAIALKDFIKNYKSNNFGVKVYILCGVLKRKSLEEFLHIVKEVEPVICPLEVEGHDSYSLVDIMNSAKEKGLEVIMQDNCKDILEEISKDSRKKIIVICGSLYLVGGIMRDNILIPS